MLLSFCHFLSGVAYVLLILKRVFQQSRQASIVCYTTQQKTNSVKTKGSSEKRHLSFEGYVIASNEPTLPQLPSCYLVVYFSRFFKFPAIQIWLPFFTENLGVLKFNWQVWKRRIIIEPRVLKTVLKNFDKQNCSYLW